MSPFPSAEKELADLERFLAAAGSNTRAGDPAFDDLRKRAERAALRLANPIRVAIVGLPGAGKSLLASFLVGEHVVRPQSRSGAGLPVILRHGDRREAYVSWWSGIDIPLPGNDLSTAGQHNPDYVEIRLPNPVLRFLSFMSLPGPADWNAQKELVRWVAGRADVLIWCAAGKAGWTDDERQLWALVPRRLQTQSLLVLTHPADALAGTPLGALPDNAITGARMQFHDVIGIATEAALVAAPGGQVVDPATWERAGGKALVGALIAAARVARRNDIALAREILARIAELRPAPPRPPEPPPPSIADLVKRPVSRPGLASEVVPPPKPARAASPVVPPKPVMPAPPTGAAAPAAGPAKDAAGPAPQEAAGAAAGSSLVRPRRPRATASIIFDELLQSYVTTSAPTDAEAPGSQERAPEDAAPRAADIPQPAPAISQAVAAAFPAPDGPEAEPVAGPAPGPAPSGQDGPAPPALARLLAGLADLSAYVGDPARFKDWEYMAQVTGLCEELTELTSRPGAMRAGGEWVARQVEEAFIALSLMQLEHGEQPCLDATTVLLQLARDLAWAEAPRQEAA
ncbi:MAG: hypothetical protein N2Z62_10775 [Rhodobacteraceae bacterium]|nr:hypothetical protein [Paracoccaceae bacterium]